MNQYFIRFSFSYLPSTSAKSIRSLIYTTPESEIHLDLVRNYIHKWMNDNDHILRQYGDPILSVYDLDIITINKL